MIFFSFILLLVCLDFDSQNSSRTEGKCLGVAVEFVSTIRERVANRNGLRTTGSRHVLRVPCPSVTCAWVFQGSNPPQPLQQPSVKQGQGIRVASSGGGYRPEAAAGSWAGPPPALETQQQQQPAPPPQQQRYASQQQQQQQPQQQTIYSAASHHVVYGGGAGGGGSRVPTAASPSNTTSSSSSQSGGIGGGGGGGSGNGGHQTSMISGHEQLSKTNLYIRGLNQNTTDKDLVNMCSQYGSIISTKAILDKNTNKCKGYGFVDFESPASAEGAVKALVGKGIQAQMAKVGIAAAQRRPPTTQQEQDPTNLYLANLPPTFKETDLDGLLGKYGQVISTRILRDPQGHSKGVGFARMDSKERCESAIQLLNGSALPGAKDPLLVKFADGGNKKRTAQFRNTDQRAMIPHGGAGGLTSGGWGRAEAQEGAQVTPYADHSAHNGATHPMISQYHRSGFNSLVQSYPMPHTSWMPQYTVMQPNPHMPQVDILHQGDQSSMQYIPQLAAHLSTLQLGQPTSYINPYGTYYTTTPTGAATGPGGTSILHAVPMGGPEGPPDHSTATSPDENAAAAAAAIAASYHSSAYAASQQQQSLK